MNNTNNYGWENTAHPNSCNYLGAEIIEKLRAIKPNRVLDLGCGNGALCSLMQSSLKDLYIAGIDYDKQGVELAKERYPGLDFFNYGVQTDPDELLENVGEQFDVVVSTEVIEHLFSPQLLPRFADKVLKDDGLLIITTPYHGYLKNMALSIFNKWDSHHSPLWEGGHIKFWSKNTLTKLLLKNGFEVIKFEGVGRLPYLWKSMLLLCRKIR